MEFLQKELEKINEFPQSVESIKTKLETGFEDLKGISCSTVRRVLKQKLNMG